MPDSYVLKRWTAAFGNRPWSLQRSLDARSVTGQRRRGHPDPAPTRPAKLFAPPSAEGEVLEKLGKAIVAEQKALRKGDAAKAKAAAKLKEQMLEALELPVRRARIGLPPRPTIVTPPAGTERVQVGTVVWVDSIERRKAEQVVSFYLLKRFDERSLPVTHAGLLEAEFEGEPAQLFEAVRLVPWASERARKGKGLDQLLAEALARKACK